jgi:hypothetical protein
MGPPFNKEVGMTDTLHHPEVRHLLDEHLKTVEDLHQKLSKLPQFASEKAQNTLHAAVKKYGEATHAFHDDVLGVTTNL